MKTNSPGMHYGGHHAVPGFIVKYRVNYKVKQKVNISPVIDIWVIRGLNRRLHPKYELIENCKVNLDDGTLTGKNGQPINALNTDHVGKLVREQLKHELKKFIDHQR